MRQPVMRQPLIRVLASLVVVALAVGGLAAPTADASGSTMYWTDEGNNKIQRANLDGTGVEDLVTGLDHARGIALDVAGGKMYWTSVLSGIRRANLDGTDVEHLVPTDGVLDAPRGIALDVAGGKMYWVGRTTVGCCGFGRIQRANLDGTGAEDLVVDMGLDLPEGIALDVVDGKMYWTDLRTSLIQRANLDGTGVEDIHTGTGGPAGIALDVAGGKMYWTGTDAGLIRRANLDGTGVEDLVVNMNLNDPDGIALDVAGGKMYWVDLGTHKVQRANLDGTGVEDLVTGLGNPGGIALDLGGGTTVTVAATDSSAAEAGPDPGSVVFTRSGDTTNALLVSFTLGGTAAQGADYSLTGSSLIPVGASSVILNVVPLLDALLEGSETVTVTVAPDAGYTVGNPDTATVTIADYAGGVLKVPSTVKFGNVPVGESKDKSLNITNRSRSQNLVVRVNAPSPNPPFSLVSGGGTVVIGPGGAQAVTLRFQPTGVGAVAGTLLIDSTDPAALTTSIQLGGGGR